MGRPYVGTQCTGEALPRPNPATPRAAHHFRGHASRFVCSGHERARWHERPRTTQWVAPTLGHNVLARHCLARIRRRPASPTISAAMPRDLFVPGMNERVGMNDRGDPVGRTPTIVGHNVLARHCLALIRRRPASPTSFRGHASRIVCSGHERARWHERPRATQWVAPTLGHNVLARHCLARIRRRPASPTINEAMPRDLFVPGMNERVGMNDRGRPSGSPLRWDTMYWRGTASPVSGDAPRRPPLTRPCLAICLFRA